MSFVDNAEIFEIATLNITFCCDKMIRWGQTMFRLVTYTYTKITISKFQVDNLCGVSSVTIPMIVVPELSQ